MELIETKMDDITNLVEEQRDLITNQTNTIERQNELIARQTEMLATMISKQSDPLDSNISFLEDCFVNCSLTIDNRIDSVSYNGLKLSVTGTLDNYKKENSFHFYSCHRYRPGVLIIKGSDTKNSERYCYYAGLLLHCIANDVSNPWHNFVTDQTHWKVSDGSTPCTDDNGWIVRQTWAFVKKMKDAGAIQIWSNTKSTTLIGTPDAP